MNHRQISRFPVGTEDQLRVGIETGSIRILTNRRSRHHLAAVRVDDHHFLVAADREKAAVFLIESKSGGFVATGQRPAVEH